MQPILSISCGITRKRDNFLFVRNRKAESLPLIGEGFFDTIYRMLVIRLQRIGKKHQPSYRLAVAEGRSKVAAPPTEDVGSYDPFSKKATINGERVTHWIKMGAQPSPTVWNLLVREKLVSGATRPIKMSKKKGSADAKPARPAGGALADKAEEVKPAAAAAEKPVEKPASA